MEAILIYIAFCIAIGVVSYVLGYAIAGYYQRYVDKEVERRYNEWKAAQCYG